MPLYNAGIDNTGIQCHVHAIVVHDIVLHDIVLSISLLQCHIIGKNDREFVLSLFTPWAREARYTYRHAPSACVASAVCVQTAG